MDAFSGPSGWALHAAMVAAALTAARTAVVIARRGHPTIGPVLVAVGLGVHAATALAWRIALVVVHGERVEWVTGITQAIALGASVMCLVGLASTRPASAQRTSAPDR